MKENNIESEVKDLDESVLAQVEKKVRKRNRPDLDKFGEENTEPGDNSRYLRYAMASLSLPPIDISDAEQVEKRIFDYFYFCEEHDRKPNMVGIANWLGVDSTTLSSWKRGEYRASTHSPVIKKAVMILEELWVDYMQNGKINPASGIFLAKNMFSYKDQQDITIRPDSPYGEQKSIEQIQQEYDALPE